MRSGRESEGVSRKINGRREDKMEEEKRETRETCKEIRGPTRRK